VRVESRITLPRWKTAQCRRMHMIVYHQHIISTTQSPVQYLTAVLKKKQRGASVASLCGAVQCSPTLVVDNILVRSWGAGVCESEMVFIMVRVCVWVPQWSAGRDGQEEVFGTEGRQKRCVAGLHGMECNRVRCQDAPLILPIKHETEAYVRQSAALARHLFGGGRRRHGGDRGVQPSVVA
jgi:hypothetical protein